MWSNSTIHEYSSTFVSIIVYVTYLLLCFICSPKTKKNTLLASDGDRVHINVFSVKSSLNNSPLFVLFNFAIAITYYTMSIYWSRGTIFPILTASFPYISTNSLALFIAVINELHVHI